MIQHPFFHIHAMGDPVAFFHTHFERRRIMNLNEDEKRMVYQIESTNQVACKFRLI